MSYCNFSCNKLATKEGEKQEVLSDDAEVVDNPLLLDILFVCWLFFTQAAFCVDIHAKLFVCCFVLDAAG